MNRPFYNRLPTAVNAARTILSHLHPTAASWRALQAFTGVCKPVPSRLNIVISNPEAALLEVAHA
jgi:hypothetical protein